MRIRYSHYWEKMRDITDDEWEMLLAGFNKILKCLQDSHDVCIAPEEGFNGFFGHHPNPKTSKIIMFNGIGDNAHQTFILAKNDLAPLESCSTAQKPYDKVVCAMLILLEGFAKGAFRIRSDGETDEWKDGVNLVASALKKPTAIIIDDDGVLKHIKIDPLDEPIFEDKPKDKREFVLVV